MNGTSPQPLDTRRIKQKLDDLDSLLERVLALPLSPMLHDEVAESEQGYDPLTATLDAAHAVQMPTALSRPFNEDDKLEEKPAEVASQSNGNATLTDRPATVRLAATDLETIAKTEQAEKQTEDKRTHKSYPTVAEVITPCESPPTQIVTTAPPSTSEMPLASEDRIASMAESVETVANNLTWQHRLLMWMNRSFETGTGHLGWFGIIVRSSPFRKALGWLGILMLAMAVAWNIGTWLATR